MTGGKQLEGLLSRRQEEAKLFFENDNVKGEDEEMLNLNFKPVPLICDEPLNCWGLDGKFIKQ